MQENKVLWILGGIIILGIIGGLFVSLGSKKSGSVQESMEIESLSSENTRMEREGARIDDNDMSIPGEDMMESDSMMETRGDLSDDTMTKGMSVGTYEAYDESKLAMASSGDVVLFFRASWCPTCRTLDADIQESLNDIPQDVTILDVDYDSASELKKKYGVTTQHTLVQVDENGDEITKWVGSNTLEDIVSRLQ